MSADTSVPFLWQMIEKRMEKGENNFDSLLASLNSVVIELPQLRF
jgi:hypothetical protein